MSDRNSIIDLILSIIFTSFCFPRFSMVKMLIILLAKGQMTLGIRSSCQIQTQIYQSIYRRLASFAQLPLLDGLVTSLLLGSVTTRAATYHIRQPLERDTTNCTPQTLHMMLHRHNIIRLMVYFIWYIHSFDYLLFIHYSRPHFRLRGSVGVAKLSVVVQPHHYIITYYFRAS